MFERGDYKRAHFIYRNELSPIGDKYAQYMVGFMTLTGLGVREDPVLASAWYRVAAERKTAPFIAVRDDLNRRLDAIEMERSDVLYLRLRREFSDIVVRMREVREDFELLHGGQTGSRTSRSGSPVIIVKTSRGFEYVVGRLSQRSDTAHAETPEFHRQDARRLERVDADNITSSRSQCARGPGHVLRGGRRRSLIHASESTLGWSESATQNLRELCEYLARHVRIAVKPLRNPVERSHDRIARHPDVAGGDAAVFDTPFE